jgi:hypothetical protein
MWHLAFVSLQAADTQGRLHNGRRLTQSLEMAKPTVLQRYYLFLIACVRWFGATFSVAAVVITASDIPWLVHSGDLKLLITNLGGGAAFLFVGLALYLAATAVQRRYRAYIDQQFD